MAKNEFLPFGIAEGANVLSNQEYERLAARFNGFISGVAKSKELNTVWRQSSVMSSALAQFIVDSDNQDLLDNGDVASIKTRLVAAIKQTISGVGYVTTAAMNLELNKKIDKANISGVKGNDNDKVPSLNLFTTETGKLATKADLATGLNGKLDKTGGEVAGNVTVKGLLTAIDSNGKAIQVTPTAIRTKTGTVWIDHVMPESGGTFMQVGDYGVGASDLPQLPKNGLSVDNNVGFYGLSGSDPNRVPGGGGSNIVQIGAKSHFWQLGKSNLDDVVYFRAIKAKVMGPWCKFYTETNTTEDSNGFLGTNAKKTTLTTDEVTQSTGSSKTSVMSQKAVTDLLANTAKNTALKAANGWWKCGDTGLIYQWGRITTVNNKFPIAFPNAITSIVISPTSGTLSSQRIGAFNTTSFEATFEYGNNTGFYFAIGY